MAKWLQINQAYKRARCGMSLCAIPCSSVSWIHANMRWEEERDDNNELTVQLAVSAEEERIMSSLSNYGTTMLQNVFFELQKG